LVLGAGASVPFGFPTARELKGQVLKLIGHAHEPTVGQRECRKQLAAAGCAASELGEFAAALGRSGKSSVDAFLEGRPEFERVGKLAMARVLVECECRSQLRKTSFMNDDWYAILYQHLLRYGDDLSQSDTSIITYNYDRSLEFFLREAYKSDNNWSDAHVEEVLSRLPLIHIHGSLGSHPFGQEIESVDMVASSDSIRIIHDEELRSASVLDSARALIRHADRVCFLGHGYDPTNVSRLQISNSHPAGSIGKQLQLPDPIGKWVVGTCKGMMAADIIRAHSAFSIRVNIDEKDSGLDVYHFLKSHCIF
jgi:hypothetical protein